MPLISGCPCSETNSLHKRSALRQMWQQRANEDVIAQEMNINTAEGQVGSIADQLLSEQRGLRGAMPRRVLYRRSRYTRKGLQEDLESFGAQAD